MRQCEASYLQSLENVASSYVHRCTVTFLLFEGVHCCKSAPTSEIAFGQNGYSLPSLVPLRPASASLLTGGCVSLGTSCLTTEERPVVPVGGGQLADVLSPVAHHPGEVASVVQTPHDDAVQVYGLDEVAEEGSLQAQHVPPAGRGRGQPVLEGSPAAWVPPPDRLQLHLLCKMPALLPRGHCRHLASDRAIGFGLVATTSPLTARDWVWYDSGSAF